MRTTPLMTAIACLALPALSLAQPKPPEGAEGGEKIFRSICATCHGAGARGDGPLAPHLAMPPLDLTKIAERRDGAFPSELIASFIDGREDISLHGPRQMPVWGDSLANAVSDTGEREARISKAVGMLVAYLETLQE